MISNIDAISFVISNQTATLEYSRDTFGIQVRMDDVMPDGMRCLMVAPPQGQTGIVLFPAGGGVKAGGSFGTVFATEDCRETHADLVSKGVAFSEEPTVQK